MIEPEELLQNLRISQYRTELELWPAASDAELYVGAFEEAGMRHLYYFRLNDGIPAAVAIFASLPPFRALPGFQITVAVAPDLRNLGKGTELVRAAVAELRRTLSDRGIGDFYVQAVVPADDEAAARVATRTIASGYAKGLHSETNVESRMYLSLASAVPRPER